MFPPARAHGLPVGEGTRFKLLSITRGESMPYLAGWSRLHPLASSGAFATLAGLLLLQLLLPMALDAVLAHPLRAGWQA